MVIVDFDPLIGANQDRIERTPLARGQEAPQLYMGKALGKRFQDHPELPGRQGCRDPLSHQATGRQVFTQEFVVLHSREYEKPLDAYSSAVFSSAEMTW
jgi:hypothetical protein